MKWYFVIPWYGSDIPGGAEAECRGAVTHLRRAGIEAEVLTTTIRDFMSDWSQNAYDPGFYKEEDIPVHRFSVQPTHSDIFGYINDRLMRDEKILPKEETYFFQEMLRSDGLFSFIEGNKGADIFIFIPYLFTTTVYGARIHPDRSLLLPCLHNESYARLHPVRRVFESCAGVLFHVEEEKNLANRLYNLAPSKQCVVGEGLLTDLKGNANRFREKYHIKDPFILYAGRKDEGKNTPLLIRYFSRLMHRLNKPVKLILIGNGNIPIPDTGKGGIIDLGFVPPQDKIDAYKAATIFCQPSLNESFSLVIMEAWLQETPVVVHADCPVTRGHCNRSNGGLYFANYPEFEEGILLLLHHPDIREQLGKNGRQYVLSHYHWEVIVKNYLNAIEDWFGET